MKTEFVTCEICCYEFSTTKWWCARFCPQCRKNQIKVRAKRYKQKYAKSGYNAWSQIKQRCTNIKDKDYEFYGARGIKLLISSYEFIKFYSSNNMCCVCNIELEIGNHKSKYGKCVDRIDSKDHYRLDNIRIVCRSCNTKQSAKKQIRGYHGRYKRA